MLQIVIIDSITSHYSHPRPDAASYLNISYQDPVCARGLVTILTALQLLSIALAGGIKR